MVALDAANDAVILSNAGGFSFALGASSGNVGGAASVGASLAVNAIDNETRSVITDSTVTDADSLSLTSASDAVIWALAVSGSGAVGAAKKQSTRAATRSFIHLSSIAIKG